VLEHVPDDRRGIAELMRVLKDGGEAVVMVPFMMGWPETVEFGSPDPDQFDHVRGYSPLDFKERLEGVDYEELFPLDIISRAEAARFQIPLDSQVIYLCRRAASGTASPSP
jgi:SAM-dependent methyltransferase